MASLEGNRKTVNETVVDEPEPVSPTNTIEEVKRSSGMVNASLTCQGILSKRSYQMNLVPRAKMFSMRPALA